jgi:hypothetical protein
MNHEQYNLPSPTNVPTQEQDFASSGNVLATSKSIVVGKNKVVLDPNKGLFSAYVVRGINTTGYSSLVVFDPTLGGFCQVRTNGDYGAATINTTTPGEKGQELYVKLDNDSDGNKTITFGTPFKVTGTVAGSTSVSAVLHFISDGTNLWEVSRTTGLAQ